MVLNTVSQVIEFDDRTLQEALEKSENAIAFVDFYAVSVNWAAQYYFINIFFSRGVEIVKKLTQWLKNSPL